MTRQLSLPLLPILVVLVLATAHGQSSPSQKPQARKTVSHASWTPTLEQSFGITPQAFQDMGLGALTTDQQIRLFSWVQTREQQAKESVPIPFFACGRPAEFFQDAKPESYEKVRVYVSATGNADEIISGVRQRLRAMNGTEVVYSSDEADLTVSLVGIQTKVKSTGYQTGVAFSVVVSQPCVWKLGTYTTHYDTIRDQFVQVGSDVSGVTDSIVSGIDTDDLETQRKTNAGYQKYLRESLKK